MNGARSSTIGSNLSTVIADGRKVAAAWTVTFRHSTFNGGREIS